MFEILLEHALHSVVNLCSMVYAFFLQCKSRLVQKSALLAFALLIMLHPNQRSCATLDLSMNRAAQAVHSARFHESTDLSKDVITPHSDRFEMRLVSCSRLEDPHKAKTRSRDISEAEARRVFQGDSGARYGVGFLLGALCVTFLKMSRSNETAVWPPASSDSMVVEDDEPRSAAPNTTQPAAADRGRRPGGGEPPLVYDYVVIGAGAAGLMAAGLGVSLGARTLLVEAGGEDGIGCAAAVTRIVRRRGGDSDSAPRRGRG